VTRSKRRQRDLVHRAAIARGWMTVFDLYEWGLPPGRVKGRRTVYAHGRALVNVAHPWTRGSRLKGSPWYARLKARVEAMPKEEREAFACNIQPLGPRQAKALRQLEAACG